MQKKPPVSILHHSVLQFLLSSYVAANVVRSARRNHQIEDNLWHSHCYLYAQSRSQNWVEVINIFTCLL